jgi:transcriptional regulator with XRE-family HTH domain
MTRSVFSHEYEQFRLLLIGARKSAGLTQVGLASALRRPQSYVSKYERGERRLDVVEFLEVARTIGIDPCEFLRQLEAARTSRREMEKL